MSDEYILKASEIVNTSASLESLTQAYLENMNITVNLTLRCTPTILAGPSLPLAAP